MSKVKQPEILDTYKYVESSVSVGIYKWKDKYVRYETAWGDYGSDSITYVFDKLEDAQQGNLRNKLDLPLLRQDGFFDGITEEFDEELDELKMDADYNFQRWEKNDLKEVLSKLINYVDGDGDEADDFVAWFDEDALHDSQNEKYKGHIYQTIAKARKLVA